jgi:hypothetical protein
VPIVRIPVAGNELVASASVFRRRVVTVPNQTTLTIEAAAIQCNNLPNAFFWIRQDTGVGGLSFVPLFAVDNTSAGGNVVPNWLPLSAPQALFLLQPTFVNQRIVATMLTIQVNNPTGQPATLNLLVAASQ